MSTPIAPEVPTRGSRNPPNITNDAGVIFVQTSVRADVSSFSGK